MEKSDVKSDTKESMRLKVLDYERRKLKREMGSDVISWLEKKVDVDDEDSMIYDSDFIKKFIDGDFDDVAISIKNEKENDW